MDDEYTTPLGPVIEDVLRECVHRLGFSMPLTIYAVSVNGSLIAMRITSEGSEPRMLARHSVSGQFILPINVMISDSEGQACHCAMKASGRTPLQ